MEFRIIEGVPDYAEIIGLINAEWPQEFGDKTDDEKIADMIESHYPGRDRTKYLYDNSEIIAFYRYSPWPRNARETETAHTYDIAVLPSRQRQGIGTLLIQDMIEDCRSLGFTNLLSRSFKSNDASIGLHRKMGFHISLETEDSIVWKKIL